MIVADWAVDKRTTVAFLMVILVIMGLTSYLQLPRESEPDITVPNIIVTTVYRGATPDDIEANITIPIEDELQGLSGVKNIESVSEEGLSIINIEFDFETNIDDVLPKVKDRVDRAKPELPSDLEDDPLIEEVNISEQPILVLSLSGEMGLRRLTDMADDLQDEIEAIPGVLEVDIAGDVTREIHIAVDPDRLAIYNTPVGAIENVVSGENQNISGGFFRTGLGRYRLSIPGEVKTVEEFEQLVIDTSGQAPVFLRDLAKIEDGLKDIDSRSRLNGTPSVTLSVRKRAGENIVEIVDAIMSLIDTKEANWPPSTRITAMMDKAKDVRMMVRDLENNILTGLFLVIAVVTVALGLRNSVLVSLSIPMSMLISFIVLQALGITLNMVVLFSLTLALGMLVDNAIVIIENIYRFMQQGCPRLEAAKAATAEVAWPIIGSAFTTIAAFFPLLFWTGLMGEFMVYLPLTVIITLISCLFVALIINPALAAFIMKADSDVPTRSAEEIMKAGEPPVKDGESNAIFDTYRRFLELALNYRFAVLVSGVLITILMIQFWMFRVDAVRRQEFFPDIDPPMIYVNAQLPEGVDIEYADTIIKEIATRLGNPRAATPEDYAATSGRIPYADAIQPKKHIMQSSGEPYYSPSPLDNVEFLVETADVGASGNTLFSSNEASNVAVQFVDLKDRTISTKETKNQITALMQGIPGADVRVQGPQAGPPTGQAVNIEISGDDFTILEQIANRVKAVVEDVPFTMNVSDDYEATSPTIKVHVNRARAALLGLTTAQVGNILKMAFNGQIVSTYRQGDEDYDILVRLNKRDRRLIETLSRLMIPSGNGRLVPLTTICTIEYTATVGSIRRINRRRTITVGADVDSLRTTDQAARQKAQDMLLALQSGGLDGEQMTLPEGYSVRFTGSQEEEEESAAFLEWAGMVAIFLILLMLVAMFNSVLYPIIILSSVFLSLAGVFWGLGMTSMSFGIVMTGVGVISLAGVVVNNAIVLVDYILLLIDRGLPVREAIINAGMTRLRPVLLTAITTILGLIPMATGVSFDFIAMEMQWISESSQWWASMATPVIFGLIMATLLTLFVVPVLFSLIHDIRRKASTMFSGAER